MVREFWSAAVVAAAIFGGAAEVLAATPGDAKVSVTRFFQAIERDDSAAYSQVAPEVYMMAAPDFGAPMSFEQARRAFEGCRLRQIESAERVDQVPGVFQVVASLACPPDRHIASIMGLLTDGQHVVAVYPGGFPLPRRR